MSVDKKIMEKQVESKSIGSEEYEVRYIAAKLNISERRVRDAITLIGNDRAAVEKYLKTTSSRTVLV